MKRSDYLDKRKNYVVQKRRDRSHVWWYQIYESRLREYASNGDFFVVAVCDAGSPTEEIMAIPYTFLKRKILSDARRDGGGRYLFDVNKQSFRVSFRPHNLAIDGKAFLV